MTDDWHTEDFPELRPHPPWVMQEMIEAEPPLLERIATTSDTAALALLLKVDGPLTVVGCGTSEHAALAAAEILTEAGTPAGSRQAYEAALDPQPGGAVLGISHEGGTWATIEALEAARRAGSGTALITARGESKATEQADAVLVTPMVDRSWCHTVGYTSPIAATLALAGKPSPGVVETLVTAGVSDRASVTAVATALNGCDHLIVVGSGADRTGLVLIEHDRRRSGPRRELGQMVRQASARVGVRCAVIGRRAPDPGMAAAGYVLTPVAAALPAAAEALLATAPAVQWLAHELAVARGVNPDLIRREQEAYREAAKFRG